jgi:hypothetical protein
MLPPIIEGAMSDIEELTRMLMDLLTRLRKIKAKMDAGFEDLRQAFDHQHISRTDSRWVERMNQWTDQQMAVWDDRNQRLEERLRKLESNGRQN